MEINEKDLLAESERSFKGFIAATYKRGFDECKLRFFETVAALALNLKDDIPNETEEQKKFFSEVAETTVSSMKAQILERLGTMSPNTLKFARFGEKKKRQVDPGDALAEASARCYEAWLNKAKSDQIETGEIEPTETDDLFESKPDGENPGYDCPATETPE